MPMFPQYSATTSASATDALFSALMKERLVPAVRVVAPYYEHPAYLDAVVAVIRDDLAKLLRGEPEHFVVGGFHGLPQDYVRKGDPYPQHAEPHFHRGTRKAHGLAASENWMQTFQSPSAARRGSNRTPTTCSRILAKRRRETRLRRAAGSFTADSPGNAARRDRATKAAKSSEHAGGEHLKNGTCLNDHPRWIEAMTQILREEGQGWL